jgi:aryl-alcohol dehydrogenase-like predicted oxidoreductase
MPFSPGVSGNPSGGKKGPRSLAVRIRSMAEKDAIEIVRKVIEGAKSGDVECRRLFLKYLLHLPRVISTPVDIPAAQSAAEAQEQIAQLTVMAARGDLDLDALQVLTRSLTLSIDTRLSELEEIIEQREVERDAA